MASAIGKLAKIGIWTHFWSACKIWWKSVKNCGRNRSTTDRWTDTHTHTHARGQKPKWLSVKCNFDRLSITLVSVCPCVCSPIGCRTITSAILYRFSPNFACRSEMWLFRTLLFLGQTGSSLTILEMCKIRFWQFRNCGGHIFPRIVIKTWIEI